MSSSPHPTHDDAERRYLALFNSIDQGFCTIDVAFAEDGSPTDYRFVEVSPSFARQTGIEQGAGRWMRQIAPDQDQHWFETYGRVSLTGEPARFEEQSTPLGRWWSVYAFRIEDRPRGRIGVLFDDITDRKRAEQRMRASEARQAFLLRLSDALRLLTDPNAIQATAVRALSGQLGAVRVLYRERSDDEYFDLEQSSIAGGAPIMAGRVRTPDLSVCRTDGPGDRCTITVDDTADTVALSADDRQSYAAIGIRAVADVPLVRDGRPVANLVVHMSRPHAWTADDVALLHETAERTWAAAELARLRRRAEELNAFLVRFSDAVRGLADPRVVAETACRLLVEELGVDRAQWAEIDWTTREYVVGAAFHIPGSAVVNGRFPFDAWEPFTSFHLARRPVVVDDTQTDPRVSAAMKQLYARMGVGADLATSVAVNGQLRGTLAVNQSHPRHWTPEETALVQGISGRCWAEVERARAEMAVRQNEERQAFLLRLWDTLQPLTDPRELQRLTAELLGKHLLASQVQYEETVGDVVVIDQGDRDGLPSAIGRFRYQDLGERLIATYRSGRTAVCCDVTCDPTMTSAEAAVILGAGVRAYVAVPLVKDGVWVATLAVHSIEPRTWESHEIATVEDTARRTWAAVRRARAEQALLESEERLREANEQLEERVRERTSEVEALFRRVVSVQEAERQRIARDIHDQLGQAITALRINLEALQTRSAAPEAFEEQAARTMRLAEELDRTADFLTWDLRPAALEHLGLPAALSALVSGWSERFGVIAEFRAPWPEGLRLAPETESNLYRVVQEALHNVAKHAQATHVIVFLEHQSDLIVLIVEDDGRGFSPDELASRSSAGHLGMLSMQERATLVGGELSVESTPGHGTSLFVRVPTAGGLQPGHVD